MMGGAAAGQDCSGRSTSRPLLTPKSQGQEDRLVCVPEPLDLFFPMWLHGITPPLYAFTISHLFRRCVEDRRPSLAVRVVRVTALALLAPQQREGGRQ